MASNGEEVRRAALAELAKRELARRQQTQQKPSLGQRIGRQAGLGSRAILEGGMDVVAPFADLTGLTLNAVLPGQPFETGHSQAFSQALTGKGLPEPQGGSEKFSNVASRIITGAATGGPIASAVTKGLGLPGTQALTAARAPQAATPAAQTLETAGVPLDRAQRQGGRFYQLLRSAVKDHPFSSQGFVNFAAKQQKAFNRAVLRSIGVNSDEATQEVMAVARKQIGQVFDDVGKQGAVFDDALQSQLAQVVDSARRTVVDSEIKPLLTNVDDILSAVDDAGRIGGDKFIKIRSNLSELSRGAGALGQRAKDAEEALLSALERSHPGQRAILREAIDKYRNLKIIEPAIAKGTTADISPLRLSNAVGSTRNRAMSVYGRGGDQGLVSLAKAGREVLPEVLPQSGTVPRGMMQAPLRAVATAPLYKAGLARLLSQPSALPPGYGVRAAAVPGAGSALAQWLAQQR